MIGDTKMKRALLNLFIGAGLLVVASYGSVLLFNAIGTQFHIAVLTTLTWKFFVKVYFGIYCICEIFSFIKRNSKSKEF